eukprot:616211-Rhodomonas_salina.1
MSNGSCRFSMCRTHQDEVEVVVCQCRHACPLLQVARARSRHSRALGVGSAAVLGAVVHHHHLPVGSARSGSAPRSPAAPSSPPPSQ